jgi:hypothetical protein
MQLTDWPHVEVALLLIGRTHKSFVKNGFEEIIRLLDYKRWDHIQKELTFDLNRFL